MIFYWCFLGVMMLSQMVGYALMCHNTFRRGRLFVTRIPIIPSLQACLMDLLIVLICWNYFDIYNHLLSTQLIFLILKLPILVKYYKEPLFTAKNIKSQPNNINRLPQLIQNDAYVNINQEQPQLQISAAPQRKNFSDKMPENPWNLLFFFTFITILGNVILYVISPDQISRVTLMLLAVYILENFAFNKRP